MNALVCSVPPPAGLLDAVAAYEDALLGNDAATLDTLFAPGPDTVRGDGTHLLVGHDAIAAFRRARAVVPTRRVATLHVRTVNADTALVMASTVEPATGATGLQTQLWQRLDGRWQVTAAHVTAPPAAPPALDRSVWRVVGDPLVPATGPGPLTGLRVAVKDVVAVAGHPVGAGNPQWLAEQAPCAGHAPVVAALLAAGATVAGIARTDEFAYSLAGTNAHHGTPPNPAVRGGIAGGSSSGPAAAVALGQAEIGLGTDTAGSIRVPASYQGLVGLRTSHGAVDAAGVLPLAPSFDTVGWLTRDAALALRVAQVLLPAPGPAPARTLVLPAVEAHAAPDVAAACARRRAGLVAAGVLPPAEEVDLGPAKVESWFAAFRTAQAREAWHHHGGWVTAHPGALGADVAARFTAAAAVTAAQADAAQLVVADARRFLTELLRGAVLVLPSTAGGAPDRTAGEHAVEAERAGTLRLTCAAGLAGAPALSLPLLRTGDGRPAGLCLVGAPGTDLALLHLAVDGGLA